jgi:hypothetical protein
VGAHANIEPRTSRAIEHFFRAEVQFGLHERLRFVPAHAPSIRNPMFGPD